MTPPGRALRPWVVSLALTPARGRYLFPRAAFDTIALWHERGISHSSVDRVILPDSCILPDTLLDETVHPVSGMQVFLERMRRNREFTKGLVFSGRLLPALTADRVLHEEAQCLLQAEAIRPRRRDGRFRAAIENHPEDRNYLNPDQIRHAIFVHAGAILIFPRARSPLSPSQGP